MTYIPEDRHPLNNNSRGGNGHAFPTSRKSFNRGLPRRVGSIEDDIEHLDARIEMLVSRVAEIEAQPAATPDVGLTMRVNNLVEIVARLAGQQQRIDKRSLRSRRKLAVIADELS